MDSGQWGDGVRPVALFGRMGDHGVAWHIFRFGADDWGVRMPNGVRYDSGEFPTWREALAAVRAADGGR